MGNDIVERCEHGIRWPHPCDDCDEEAIKPHNLITKINEAATTIQALTADLARVTAERDARDARIEALDLIDALRAAEGHSVTICHDNPDFGGANCTIFVSQDYGVTDKQYFGETILDCLRQARAALGGNNAE